MSEEVKEEPKATDAEKTEARRKIDDSRARLVFDQPFFGVLLSQCDTFEDESIPTAATDGKRIWYNPQFIAKLDDSDVRAVLMHELLHVIYMHCDESRRQTRGRQKWNVSADYAINIELNDMGYRLPHFTLYDDKYRGSSVEQVYDVIPDEEADKSQTFDTHIPGDATEIEEMADAICAAAEATKDAGDLPAGIRRWLEKMRKPKVPWQRVFQRYVGQALAKDDYSFARPNRRFISEDLYMPELHSNKIGNVVVAVDTSGSITGKIIEEFSAEMNKINHLVDEVTAISCDCVVHEVVKLHSFSEFLGGKFQFKGGGGTAFEPVFDKIKEKGIRPELMIYLTDGWGSFPAKAPPYPVIWVLTKGGNPAPWGKNIELPSAQEDNARF